MKDQSPPERMGKARDSRARHGTVKYSYEELDPLGLTPEEDKGCIKTGFNTGQTKPLIISRLAIAA